MAQAISLESLNSDMHGPYVPRSRPFGNAEQIQNKAWQAERPQCVNRRLWVAYLRDMLGKQKDVWSCA